MFRRLRFLFFYLLFLLAFLEVVCRLLYATDVLAPRLRGRDDASQRRYWAARHRGEIEIYYRFDVYDPTKGWISRPNLRNEIVFGNKVLNTNSTGLRGTRDYSPGRHPDKLRIVVLGDSFTFGDDVSDDETYCHFLEERLPDTEVINMGVHGYGHDQMLILLEEQGVRYRPDIVILGFLYGDAERNLMLFRDFAKPKFVPQGGGLKLTGSPVPTPEQVVKRQWLRPRLADLLSLLSFQARLKTGRHAREKREVTYRILRQMVSTIDEIDAVPIFVYLPLGLEARQQMPRTRGERFLFSYCATDERVACFSARPTFQERRRRGGDFKLRGHWTPRGHRTVAEAIEHYLIDNGFVTAAGVGASAVSGPP